MECILVIGGFFLLVGLLALYGRQEEKKRLHQMKQMSAELKLHFSAKIDTTAYLSELPAFYLFSQGSDRQMCNVMRGIVDDRVTMTIFDYRYTESIGESSTGICQTVLLFQSAQLHLPFFSIRGKTFFHWLTGRSGYEIAKFPRHRDRLFPNIYFVERRRGEDVQAIFSLPLLSFCERHRLISIEGEQGSLLFYQPSKQVEPHDLPGFIEKGREALALFLRE